MPRVFWIVLIGIVFLIATPALAIDETYTLKLYKSKPGDKSEHEASEISKADFFIKAGGMEMKEGRSSGKKETYTEEILEKKAGDRLATKLTRTYKVAEKTEKGGTTKAVYAGKTVLIEKKGGEYAFSIDGKALKESEAPDLFKGFNNKKDELKAEDFLPEYPVKVGESWKVPAEKSERLFKTLGHGELRIDAKKSTVGGKLLRVYKKDGAQFGILEVTIIAFVTQVDFGGRFTKTGADSRLVLTGILDTCIDGTIESDDTKMTVTLDLTAKIPDVGMVAIKGIITGVDKGRALKK